MKIEFGGLTEKRIEEFNGGKGAINLKSIDKNDDKFLSARLEPGSSVGMHKHTDTSEIIIILSGKAKAICDGETEMLVAGSCHFCPRGSSHTLMNIGEDDLVFVAAVPRQI